MSKQFREQVETIKKQIKTVYESKEVPRTDVADALEELAGEADSLLADVTESLEAERH